MHFLATNDANGIISIKGIFGQEGVSGTGYGDASLILLASKTGQSFCPKTAISISLLVLQNGMFTAKNNVSVSDVWDIYITP
jgi:hypothetical protein